MAIEGEIIPAVRERSRTTLDACKALYNSEVWIQSGEGFAVLANNVLTARAQEREAFFGEALSAFGMRRAN